MLLMGKSPFGELQIKYVCMGDMNFFVILNLLFCLHSCSFSSVD